MALSQSVDYRSYRSASFTQYVQLNYDSGIIREGLCLWYEATMPSVLMLWRTIYAGVERMDRMDSVVPTRIEIER